MNLLSIDSRSLQFYYSDDGVQLSHIAAKAFINGQWRFFDPTWSTFYYDQSYHDIPSFNLLQTKGITSYKKASNTSHLWFVTGQENNAKPDSYLKSNASVIYGEDQGQIKIDNRRFLDDGKVDVSNLPNYIGDNIDDGEFEGINLLLDGADNDGTLSVNVTAHAGCQSNTSQLCLNDSCTPVENGLSTFPVKQGQPSLMQVKSRDNVCYLVFDEVAFQASGG